MLPNKIPISVIIVTKNEAQRIAATLSALSGFEDIWVVDSKSRDATRDIAFQQGAQVVNYTWDGQYPKKRQWVLENCSLKYERIFFVDADEIVTPDLVSEIASLDWQCAGYFIKGRYMSGGKILRYGLHNNKLCLFDRRKIEFPVVDDLDLEGMGEIEGHYQPMLKAGHEREAIGQLLTPILHDALDDMQSWRTRHLRYAKWEAGMNKKNTWPRDPKVLRQILKIIFRGMPFRDLVAFIHCYVFALGFLDGRAGYEFAKRRGAYYRMINDSINQ